jgi:hypothetical protein
LVSSFEPPIKVMRRMKTAGDHLILKRVSASHQVRRTGFRVEPAFKQHLPIPADEQVVVTVVNSVSEGEHQGRVCMPEVVETPQLPCYIVDRVELLKFLFEGAIDVRDGLFGIYPKQRPSRMASPPYRRKVLDRAFHAS